MRWFVLLIAVAALALAAVPASAMSFRFATTSDGLKVVVASGDIKRGDARRLAKALAEAGRDRHGSKRLYLDSDGGVVVEALKMAEVMSAERVATIVRKGNICASACASILFVAGRSRTVEKGGLLAIHGCYDALTGRGVSDCNAAIAAHADAAGVSGVTVMALQEAAGADSVIVFESDDAACFGLTLKPGQKPSRRVPKCMRDLGL